MRRITLNVTDETPHTLITVKVPTTLHKQLKLHAVMTERPLHEIVTEALQRYAAQQPINSATKDMPPDHRQT